MGGPGSGRRKGPVENRIARGDYRPSRDGAFPAPEPAKAVCVDHPPPDGLNEHGREEWDRLLGIVFSTGTLTEKERQAFYNYCYWYGQFKQAAVKSQQEPTFPTTTKTDKDGKTVTIESNTPNRWITLAGIASDKMQNYARDLGLTPMTRGRVVKARPDDQQQKQEDSRPRSALDGIGPLNLKIAEGD